ncbi:rRNA N6-adenosine-methyltransferase ZCCHC4-like isoform X2 [Scylla paramamosain]|uniref:rRNA N6-adenosine-methyltransferase ZCCHC4-like isoform X2 n=1 Tax=Scylla paramamosain TaxID=85552 RepID=UPI00308289C4
MAARGVAVVGVASTENPACVHGPTVVFERFLQDGSTRRFYACAACRDRKDCAFFLWADQTLSHTKRRLWADLYTAAWSKIPHRERYKKLKAVRRAAAGDRVYCKTCCVLLLASERESHLSCSLTTPLTDTQLAQPSTCSFFPPESFLHYNMFNHHLFGGTAAHDTYLSFLAANEKLVLVSDPPFGGRMELLAHTLHTIEADWRTAAALDPQATLPVFLVFPYFLEAQVVASLPTLAMMDYQVDYDNHPIYSKGPKGMKHGSAVRVFTNQPLHALPLPGEEGYRWCEPCRRWVHHANAHCEVCRACTSKDGRTYKHCDECERCVKPAWVHCATCGGCRPPDHQCSTLPLGCYTCGDLDHKHLACPKRKRSVSSRESKKKKRKKGSKESAVPGSLADERHRDLDILAQLVDGK